MKIERTSTGPIILEPLERKYLENRLKQVLGGSYQILSVRTGIPTPHLHAYLNGKKSMSVQQLARIVDSLGLVVQCKTTITLHEANVGLDVTNAPCTPLEETLLSEDLESLQGGV